MPSGKYFPDGELKIWTLHIVVIIYVRCFMIIFGIDASTKSTGYSVFDGKKLMEYGVIKSNKEILIRILEISNQLESLFDKYNPEIVYIEDVPLSSAVNRRVAEYLLLLQGCILRICLLHNINFIQLEPSNWRRLVGLNSSRKREEQKESAIKLVNETYSLEYKWIDKKYDEKTGNSDICEAILIGMAGIRKDVIEWNFQNLLNFTRIVMPNR